MGRSQVLYNRTKGRFRNRHAAGRGEGGASERNAHGRTNNNNNNSRQSKERQQQQQQKEQQLAPPPQPAPSAPPPTSSTKSRRPKVDESILLADPPTTFSTLTKPQVEDESLFAHGGMIDIASMAATLTSSMSLSQRLRVPSHVAHQLLHPEKMLQDPKRSNNDSSRATKTTTNMAMAMKTTTTTSKTRNAEVSATVNDDASYSVAHTRLRVGADGQVEVRPKPGHFNPLAEQSSEDDDDNNDGDNDNMDKHQNTLAAKGTTAAQSNRKESHGPTYQVQTDESEADDYYEDEHEGTLGIQGATSEYSGVPVSPPCHPSSDDDDDVPDRYLVMVETNDDDDDNDDYIDHGQESSPDKTTASTTAADTTLDDSATPMPTQSGLSDNLLNPLPPSTQRQLQINTGWREQGRMPITTAPTPKHANNRQVSMGPAAPPAAAPAPAPAPAPPATEGEGDDDTDLEEWLDQATKSKSTEGPPRPKEYTIAIDPIEEDYSESEQDAMSSTGRGVIALSSQDSSSSSMSTLTASKAGIRQDRTAMQKPSKQRGTRRQHRNWAEDEDEMDDVRLFSVLGGITSAASGSTMNSRGRAYDDDGSFQPHTRRPHQHQNQPHQSSTSPPYATHKPSRGTPAGTSQKKGSNNHKAAAGAAATKTGGEDLDAWLDSVIS